MTARINYTNVQEVQKVQDDFRTEKEFTMDLSTCPKCNMYHSELKFIRLKNPVTDGNRTFTHVSSCPDTQLQIRLAWEPAVLVASREKANQLAQAGNALKIEGMSDEDIQKVLATLRETHV